MYIYICIFIFIVSLFITIYKGYILNSCAETRKVVTIRSRLLVGLKRSVHLIEYLPLLFPPSTSIYVLSEPRLFRSSLRRREEPHAGFRSAPPSGAPLSFPPYSMHFSLGPFPGPPIGCTYPS